jgi:hypothetical protein
MSDLERLLDLGGGDEFLRGLLESSKEDVPDATRRALTLSRLSPDGMGGGGASGSGSSGAGTGITPTLNATSAAGLGAGEGSSGAKGANASAENASADTASNASNASAENASNASAENASSAVKAGPATASSTATAVGGGAMLKWVVVVGLAAGVLGYALYQRSSDDPVTPSVPVARQPNVSSVSSVPSAPGTLSVPSALLTNEGAPTGSALPTPSASSASSVGSAAASGLTANASVKAAPSASAKERAPLGLSEETAILDRARGAINHGDPRAALSELDRYDSAPGPKILGQEATLVRIEALSAKGDAAGARALAQRFLANNPGSTYDERVRAILAEPKKP